MPHSLHTAETWIQALLDSKFKFEVPTRGFPGRLRLPPEWEARTNTYEDHLLYFVVDGGFTAEFDAQEVNLKKGDLLWLPPGMAFHFWIKETQFLTVYRLRLLSHTAQTAAAIPRLFRSAWPCQIWLDHLADEISHRALARQERLRGLLLCLFTELVRIQETGSSTTTGFSRGQRERIYEFFILHSKARPTPAQLAGHLQLSPEYFTKIFQKSFGQSPRRWLMEQRIRLGAARLLESEQNISQVADELGYENLFLFSRQFKEVLGVSPQQYRRQRKVFE